MYMMELSMQFYLFFHYFIQCQEFFDSKKNILPLLDDLLYNTVTWMIPLIVSFTYDDLIIIKIFAFVNIGLHLFCALFIISLRKKLNEMRESYFFSSLFFFFKIFPVIAIPIFWILYIIKIDHVLDSIGVTFIVLFALLLTSFAIFVLIIIPLTIDLLYFFSPIISYILSIPYFMLVALLIRITIFKNEVGRVIVCILMAFCFVIIWIFIRFIDRKTYFIGSIIHMIIWVIFFFTIHQVCNWFAITYLILILMLFTLSIGPILKASFSSTWLFFPNLFLCP